MRRTPPEILDRLVAILPAFATYWESGESLFRAEDGSFTLCGVFAECATFVRAHYEQLSPAQRRELAEFAAECMSTTDPELAEAVAACFLENLAFERFSKEFGGFLQGEAFEFYQNWHG